jgi:hypothetical protein
MDKGGAMGEWKRLHCAYDIKQDHHRYLYRQFMHLCDLADQDIFHIIKGEAPPG